MISRTVVLVALFFAAFCATFKSSSALFWDLEEVNRDIEEVIDASPSPEPTETPLVCTNPDGRAARVGRCICFLLFNNKIALRNRGMAKRECVRIFGNRSEIKDRKASCKRFRIKGGGKTNRAKLARLADKFLKLCEPDNEFMVILREMAEGLVTPSKRLIRDDEQFYWGVGHSIMSS